MTQAASACQRVTRQAANAGTAQSGIHAASRDGALSLA